MDEQRYEQSPEDYTCEHCGHDGHEHDKEMVVPDDGPPGTYHYKYHCPDDT